MPPNAKRNTELPGDFHDCGLKKKQLVHIINAVSSTRALVLTVTDIRGKLFLEQRRSANIASVGKLRDKNRKCTHETR